MGTHSDAEAAYRGAIEQSLVGRTASGVARTSGLPKDCIRDVLQGRSPKVGRADAICRALGITFVLGAGDVDEAPDHEHPLPSGSSVRREPVRDIHLAELISRLADLWDRSEQGDRAGLALALSSVLDLVGAHDGAARGRTVETLSWRVDREDAPSEPTSTT